MEDVKVNEKMEDHVIRYHVEKFDIMLDELNDDYKDSEEIKGYLQKVKEYLDSLKTGSVDIAECFYSNSDSSNVVVATDYKPNEISQVNEMSKEVAQRNIQTSSDDETDSHGDEAKDNIAISSFNAAKQKSNFENEERIHEKSSKLNEEKEDDFYEKTRQSNELTKGSDMNKVTETEHKKFQRLLNPKTAQETKIINKFIKIMFDWREKN